MTKPSLRTSWLCYTKRSATTRTARLPNDLKVPTHYSMNRAGEITGAVLCVSTSAALKFVVRNITQRLLRRREPQRKLERGGYAAPLRLTEFSGASAVVASEAGSGAGSSLVINWTGVV